MHSKICVQLSVDEVKYINLHNSYIYAEAAVHAKSVPLLFVLSKVYRDIGH